MNTTTMMDSRDVLLDVMVEDQQQLFELIAQHIFQCQGVSPQFILNALTRRERLGSTAVGNGVAIPHARVEGFDRIYIVYARLAKPVPYLTPDSMPVRDVLALLVPNPAVDEHLTALAHISRAFAEPKFRDELDRCTQQQAVATLFCEYAIGYPV